MLTIKQIFQDKVRHENFLFFFNSKREKMKLKEKNNKFVSNFFFKSEKKKHVRIRDKSNM